MDFASLKDGILKLRGLSLFQVNSFCKNRPSACIAYVL